MLEHIEDGLREFRENLAGSELPHEWDSTNQATDMNGLHALNAHSTGSFDLRAIETSSFGKSLDALPIPALLIDQWYRVVFCNQACAKISPDYVKIQGKSFLHLLPSPADTDRAVALTCRAHSLLQRAFETRKPQQAEAILSIDENRIWCRLLLRSVRMQLQRYLLALIEDLTPERTQMRLNHKKELQLLRANKELEERLRRVDALVFDASEKLQQKMTGHSLSEDRLANERRQFQVLVELTRSGLAIVRDDGAFKYTNSRFKELFGYDLADLPNCRESFAEASADSGHASEEEVCWFDVLSAADEGQSGPLTLTVTCKSGQKKMVDFKTVKLDNGDYLLLCEETAT